jgi:putative SOS response-associated peptidase YedK
MINARADTLTSKPAYREPFKHRRCLVAVDGR